MCTPAQELQNDLEAEQVKVNSLTHMVVVVDENSGDSTTVALEEQLQVWCLHFKLNPEFLLRNEEFICILTLLNTNYNMLSTETYYFFVCVQSLGERWAAVCRWTEERWQKLQEVFLVWQQLLSDQVSCSTIIIHDYIFYKTIDWWYILLYKTELNYIDSQKCCSN